MATITSTIVLQNRMSPALNAIVKSLNSTINAMSSVDRASSQAFAEARRDILDAQRAVDSLSQEISNLPPEIEQATSAFSNMQAKIITINQAVNLIQTAISGISKLASISDGMTQTSARLNLINDGTQDSIVLQRKVYEAAQRSRGAYEDLADTVANLNLLAGNAFTSNDEAIQFAEIMQKAFAVSGTDAAAQSGALRQISQALASGTLRGEEFNSVLENAPLIAMAIEQYMGVSRGELRKLASEGVITSDIIKNAVFAAGETINSQFASMPITFGAVMNSLKNTAMMEFQELNGLISSTFNNPAFQEGIQQISSGIAKAAKLTFSLVSAIVSNWDKVSAVMTAVAVGIGIVTTAIAVQKAQVLISNIATAAKIILEALSSKTSLTFATATLQASGATLTATGTQWAYNASLLAFPGTWIVIAILAIVAVLAYWIKKVGGFRIAWLIAVNAVLTAFDKLRIGFYGVYVAMSGIAAQVRIAVIDHLEKMVNDAINTINKFIGLLNKIPGVNIQAIEQVSFAAQAKAAIEAEQKAKEEALSDMERKAVSDRLHRELEIIKLQNEAANSAEDGSKKETKLLEEVDGGVSSMNDTLQGGGGGAVVQGKINLAEEDIKLLKDVAAVEWVNKFTTLQPNLQVSFGDVHETVDTRNILGALEEIIVEAYESALEGEGI